MVIFDPPSVIPTQTVVAQVRIPSSTSLPRAMGETVAATSRRSLDSGKV